MTLHQPRRLISAALFAAALIVHPALAQQPAAPATPAPAAAAPAAPAGLDPKILAQYEGVAAQKFSRTTDEVFHTLERANKEMPASKQTATDRFMQYFRSGDWPSFRAELNTPPPEVGRKIYDKMLADLTEKPKPNVKLDDIVAIIDMVPGDFTNDEVHKLGQLLGLAIPVSEGYWIDDRFKKGTEKVGGADPAKHLLAGRMLLAGGYKDLARAWLPTLDNAQKLPDEAVKNELVAFLSTQQESEAARRGQVQKIWEDNVAILTSSNVKMNEWERAKAGTALAKIIAQMPPTTLAPAFTDLVKSNPDGAVKLIGAVGRKALTERAGDVATRTDNLKAVSILANILIDLVDTSAQPWSPLIDILTDSWEAEADNTFTMRTDPPNNNPRYILPEDVLASAPSAKWVAALSPGAHNRFDASLSHAILASGDFDQASGRIVEIGKRSPAAGVALAEDFLSVWAKTHNPQIPETLRKRYELPDDARIPVTPIMMEKNIESLSRMMKLFRDAGIAPRDYVKVVNAFDLAYSSAESYRTSHIEQVFGPLDKMDESLFFLILSKMNTNLGERWRKMDTQRAGLTRRDEGQTLEMVRSGYDSELVMIESWLKGHPDASRALTLAGTLLTDWGDFEYFQELTSADPKRRMVGYKEKNMQAQDYFERGAAAYAKEVPKLAAGDYSIDSYLSWFNALLGIGPNGRLNLSKAMNRAALTKIREHIQALPDKAAAAHMSMFAKVVNTRLADDRDPLNEDLKYRYLASSIVIIKDDPFSIGATKKVAYFDQLLSEIRLQTKVDGPTTIGREQVFGIVVSVIHTEAMGRVAKFGQYLTNEAPTLAGKPKKKAPLAKKMRETQGPRDEFELTLTETLAPFFDIKQILFASPDVKPRATQQVGWEETPLAYILVHAKDASVDRIPPVQMDLHFVDLSGPVTIPAESAETVIKISTVPEPPRPASKIEITQTLDTRSFMINGALPLEIKATASGLVPELEDLLDLTSFKKAITVKNVSAHEGVQLKELNTWGDQVAPTSERLWTLSLDGDPIRAKDVPTEFHFPAPKSADTVTVYQTYQDMNLANLPEATTRLGRAGAISGPAPSATKSDVTVWIITMSVAALILFAAIFGVKPKGEGAGSGRSTDPALQMPGVVDGFAIVALLRRLRSRFSEAQRADLQQDLQRVQKACFGSSSTMSETDLRGVAEKWLRLAS